MAHYTRRYDVVGYCIVLPNDQKPRIYNFSVCVRNSGPALGTVVLRSPFRNEAKYTEKMYITAYVGIHLYPVPRPFA